MIKNKRYIDLHIHSNYSDGLLCPKEIFEIANKRNLAAISITDHDSVEAIDKAFELQKEYSIEVIPGIEISVFYKKCEFHLLGYFIDHYNDAIRRYTRLLSNSREKRGEEIVKVLNKQGVNISFDFVKKKANGAPIGRPHIAEVMVEEGYVFSAYEAFQKYLGENRPADIPKYNVGPEKAVDIIKQAKGLVFLAHPGTIDCCEELIRLLLEYGLDGLETIHPKHNLMSRKHFSAVAKKYGLLESGGSDCHGGRDGNIILGTQKIPEQFLVEMKARIYSIHQSA